MKRWHRYGYSENLVLYILTDALEMIRNDPDFSHAYDMYELTRIDYKLGMQGAP
jgi:hypothetical protein